MDQEETFLALKEILPELENRLRQNIELEYQQELQQAQMFYKKYAEEMVNKKQQEMREQMEMRQTHLRRQLSLMQRERQQWLTLQQNYRQSIFQLTSKLKQPRNSSFNHSALNEKMQENTILLEQNQNNHDKMVGWKKKHSNQMKKRNSLPSSQQYESSFSISKLTKNINSIQLQKDLYNEIEEKSFRKDLQINNRGYKIANKNSLDEQAEVNERGRRQDTMVLSPPKIFQRQQMKESMLEPPSVTISSSKASIFQSGEGKKKLLSMIRNMK